MKSVMSHSFAQIPSAEIQRSSFNRSHGYKTTFNAGYLVPIFCDEVLPGDTFNLNATTFARIATPIVPIMDNLFADTFFFFVPARLLWSNWERFNGAQDDPGDSTDFTIPVLNTTPAGAMITSEGDLADYFGLPVGTYNNTAAGYDLNINALPFRAYNLVYNEWFRDQNLQNSRPKNIGDGPDSYGDYLLMRRGKRHDYFTSALPWPQKGDAVSLPLGTSAPVMRSASAPQWLAYQAGSQTLSTNTAIDINTSAAGFLTKPGYANLSLDPNGGLYTDLASATGATINALREAFQIQRLLERDARGGTRYVEQLLAHFGVVSPDFRLQRPEYLGGSSTRVTLNPVAQTSSTDATTPQGNLAASGTFSHTGRNGFVKSFVEHGYILGLISVRADLTYQQGLNKMWSRRTRYDFYWPALSHLGEQAVSNREIYMAFSTADDDVFGYQERYAEYRYKPSLITGQFRSTSATPLDMWHLSQEFTVAPTLDSGFIVETPPMQRVKAVTSEPDFLLDVYFSLITARPMPTYSVPGFIDRF